MATNQPQAPPPQQEDGPSFFSKIIQGMVRLFILFSISKFLFGGFGAKKNTISPTITTSTDQATTTTTNIQTSTNHQQTSSIPPTATIQNMFPLHSQLKMLAFLTNDSKFDYDANFSPFWMENEIIFNSGASSHRKFSTNFTKNHSENFSDNTKTDENVKKSFLETFDRLTHNQTQYLHMFFMRHGIDYRPTHPNYHKFGVHSIVKPLNRYLKVKKSKKRNLLSASSSSSKSESKNGTVGEINNSPTSHENEAADSVGSFYHSEIYVSMVDFSDRITAQSMPQHILDQLTIRPKYYDSGTVKRQKSQVSSSYFYDPVIYFNDFWVIRDRMIQLNESVEHLPFSIEISPTSTLKWQFFVQMQMSLDMQKSLGTLGGGGSGGELDGGETDTLKKLFLETNPYLLGITMIVSLLHSIFDFLAFKNDISFWRNKENMEGMSIKSLFVNCVFQTLILLYLMDNETSWLILGSSFVGLLIEYWKLKKAVNFKRKSTFPYVTYEDKHSYTESKTKEYDDEAMTYLSYVLYPLIVCYAIYSLYYESHKSWYSWVLSTAVGFIYMFGFIMMLPQLFINYKLKSVAHLPWKTFMYKALNTFIDDLFSFVIKMPTLHRLACFRDDIVFFIYLYQRWIYRVDYTRVNEFGQCAINPETGEPMTATTTTDATPAVESEETEEAEEAEAIEASSSSTSEANEEQKDDREDEEQEETQEEVEEKEEEEASSNNMRRRQKKKSQKA